jgi:hypothetical protein
MVLENEFRKFLRRNAFNVPRVSLADLETNCRIYEDGDWDSVYRIASTLVREGWSNPPNLQRVIDGLNVLLRIWNQQFYGPFGFDEAGLEEWLRRNWQEIDSFRGRDISSFSESDHEAIFRVFGELLDLLRKTSNDTKRSPVSVGKALHLIAPRFFPAWDSAIAHNWKCPYSTSASVAYIVFCHRIQEFAAPLEETLAGDSSPRRAWLLQKTLLKRIDEYNYVERDRVRRQ